ncbi:MAG: glycosyltransferase family 2 protein [Chloroflexota bacterium]
MVETASRARLRVPGQGVTLDLSIVIVTYNVVGLLRACLRSVVASEGEFDYEVIVVDNRSSDGSAVMVRREFPEMQAILSPVNGGYAYGNNLGLARASGRYVLLLNPDTELPPTALADMLTYLDLRPWAGAAGPKLVRADGSLDLACRRSFPTPEVSLYRMLGLSRLFPRSRRFGRYNLTYLDPDVPTEVDSVVGAFMLMRGKALEQVGLLDESFFMYGEDLDMAFRLKQVGWRILYNPAVVVLHRKGESSKQRKVSTTYEFYRAMLVFYRKHYWRENHFLLNWLVTLAIVARGAMMIGRLLVGRVIGR